MKHSNLCNLNAIRRIGLRIMAFAIPLILIPSLPAQSTTKGQCASPDGKLDAWILVDDSKSNHLCVDPKVDWRSYESVQIAPATFVPSGSTKPPKPEAIQKLTAYFDASLREAYKDHAGGGLSFSVKPTIADAKRARPAVNVIGMFMLPVVFSYGGASIRYDIIDSKTGETIAVLTDTRQGRFYDVPEGFSSLGHSRVVLKRSAKQLRKNTDRLRAHARALSSAAGRDMALNEPAVVASR